MARGILFLFLLPSLSTDSKHVVNAPNYVSLSWFSCFLFASLQARAEKKRDRWSVLVHGWSMEKRVFDCFLVSLVLRIDRIASTKAVRVEFVEVNDIVNVIDSDDNREEKKRLQKLLHLWVNFN